MEAGSGIFLKNRHNLMIFSVFKYQNPTVLVFTSSEAALNSTGFEAEIVLVLNFLSV